jgi:hypothetical protein
VLHGDVRHAVFLGDRPHARYPSPAELTCWSKYSSNFRRWWLYLRVCDLACDFIARWFASFATVDQRLPEQRRNR